MHLKVTHDSRNIYRAVALIWALLFAVAVWQIVASDIQRARSNFIDHASAHFLQANDRVRINESVLEGFSAMIGAVEDLDLERIRFYARQMLKQYPQIYAFEIVEKVPGDKLATFIDYYRRNVQPDFEVKGFNGKAEGEWQPVQARPLHLLLVFLEPMRPESRMILGLDLSQIPFARDTLLESERKDQAASTIPFSLIEGGGLAYLLVRPILGHRNNDQEVVTKSGALCGFAGLVIRADTLLTEVEHSMPGSRVLIYNPAFAPGDPRGHLFLHQHERTFSWLEEQLFPRLYFSRRLESQSQPFVLRASQQLGWDSLSWAKLGLTLMIGLITFMVMIIYARLYLRNEMERAETTARLFHLANHDALTGLANRNLLFDRLNHAISQAERQQRRLAVLFLDLEKFKQVNDSYGHERGDRLLKQVAERLNACVRSGDTIARMGGDEFVMVLENIVSGADTLPVTEKIRAAFEQPFRVDTYSIRLGISIGKAIYPEDGRDVETLLARADADMYENKRAR